MCTQSHDLSEHTHAWDRGVVGGQKSCPCPQVVQSPEGEANTLDGQAGSPPKPAGRGQEGCLEEELGEEWRSGWRKDNQEGRQLSADRHLEEPPRAALLRKDQVAQQPPTHAYAFVMLQSVVLLCS